MMRCKHCGHLVVKEEAYCRGCGFLAEPIEDKSIADYALWIVLGAILNIFTIILYAYLFKKEPIKALSSLFGMFSLFIFYFVSEIINLIFK